MAAGETAPSLLPKHPLQRRNGGRGPRLPFLFPMMRIFITKTLGTADSKGVEKLPMSTAIVIDQLRRLGGEGPLKSKDWRIRCRIPGWHRKAPSAVRHLLHGERKPSVQEAKEIEAAHLKWCAEEWQANREASRKLFDQMRASLAAMEASDPEFFRPHIEAARAHLLLER